MFWVSFVYKNCQDKNKTKNKKTLWLKFLNYRLKSKIISLVQLQANLTRARHVVTLWEYAPSRSGLTFKIHQRNPNGLIMRSPKREAQPKINTQLYIWKLCLMGKNVFLCNLLKYVSSSSTLESGLFGPYPHTTFGEQEWFILNKQFGEQEWFILNN